MFAPNCFFTHCRLSILAHATTVHGNQTLFPEVRALQIQHKKFLTKSTEISGLLDALCKVLIQTGVTSSSSRRRHDSLSQQFGERTIVIGTCLCCASLAAGMLRARLPLVS